MSAGYPVKYDASPQRADQPVCSSRNAWRAMTPAWGSSVGRSIAPLDAVGARAHARTAPVALDAQDLRAETDVP